MDGNWKPNVEISPNCPRCGSSNTKFCYYNNYSLTQPRYFCKGCRRYWTKGGSLRNVPVGGGCRKNRRGKSFRILTDRVARSSSDATSYSGHGSAMVESSTGSSAMHDGPNIDLALVYANFLNQKPDSKSTEMAELAGEFHPSLEFSGVPETNLDSGIQIQDGLVGCLREDNQVYLGGFHSIQTPQEVNQSFGNYGLPPLPGQEVAASEEMLLWSNPQVIQETQLPDLEPEAAQDPSMVTAGNWSPFDLSSYETFSRP